MNVTAIRVGRTFNLGNYESRKVEIEVIPDNGQTFDEAMAAVNEIVEKQGRAEETGATTKPAPKKPAPSNNKPPLAKGAKSEKANPTQSPTTSQNSPASRPATQPAEPPFDPGQKIEAEPQKKKRGRKPKTPAKPDHEKELQFTLDSETLEELDERFASVRTMAAAFGSIENWEGALSQVAGRYRELNSPTADPEIVNRIIAAFKAERTAIEERRASEAGAAA